MARPINEKKQEERINYLLNNPEFLNGENIECTVFWRLKSTGFFSPTTSYRDCIKSIKLCIKEAKKRINSGI
jgi:hypothetical protein